MLRTMKALNGFTIGATDGDIGTVKDSYFDDLSFTVRYVVVDTGGWLAERKVLLSPIAVRAMDWDHKRITAALTKRQAFFVISENDAIARVRKRSAVLDKRQRLVRLARQIGQ